MDRIGIDKTCFCTQPYGGYGDVSIRNERLAAAVASSPDRFCGYVTKRKILGGNAERLMRQIRA